MLEDRQHLTAGSSAIIGDLGARGAHRTVSQNARLAQRARTPPTAASATVAIVAERHIWGGQSVAAEGKACSGRGESPAIRRADRT